MPRKLDFQNLRLCLENYQPTHLFIRDCGRGERVRGITKVSENLEGKTLTFRKNRSGLYLSVNSREIFHFPLEDYENVHTRGFSLAYERVDATGEYEKELMLPTGVDPYDPNLPEPRQSFLRHDLDHHLLEIYFQGRVHLKFHSWMQRPHFKYWKVVKEKTSRK